jgi:hypothetical protein
VSRLVGSEMCIRDRCYGASDRYAAYPASNAVRPMDLVATVYAALGVPQHLELRDQQSRPMVICPGEPLLPLFG